MAYMRLGDLLIAAGAITGEQLQAALQAQKTSGQRLGDVLIDSGVIAQRQLIDALQMQLGVDYIDLTRVSIPWSWPNTSPGPSPKNTASSPSSW